MITPERIAEIEHQSVDSDGNNSHLTYCATTCKKPCDCLYKAVRELLSELKDSLAREEKNREQIARFTKQLTTWIEEQIV